MTANGVIPLPTFSGAQSKQSNVNVLNPPINNNRFGGPPVFFNPLRFSLFFCHWRSVHHRGMRSTLTPSADVRRRLASAGKKCASANLHLSIFRSAHTPIHMHSSMPCVTRCPRSLPLRPHATLSAALQFRQNTNLGGDRTVAGVFSVSPGWSTHPPRYP